ncbi:aldo/keto reductase [Streptomyces sp. A3M-1-3]|uniref:aldo/keto reductase n=1 Tax=Streptomyces sp. A3M-1-3 TaxID=2962044 RepID=UPI0020B8F61A|nr:aldo/keto reductase [Streptomyces sp. A3M-1-3]MCP3820774.1 aldo/keto reductase [Streptomyces sp. A3M-1-3]
MRQLGRSGLLVSELSLGTMTLGGKNGFQHMGGLSVIEARRLIDTAADTGVNFIDTADMYSGGQSEEMLGAALGPLPGKACTTVRRTCPAKRSGRPTTGASATSSARRSASATRRRPPNYSSP